MVTEPKQAGEMAARYAPAEVEARWYRYWEEHGLFQPLPQSEAPTFVITIPPPNITGELHMGHALTYGIEDILGRYKRMRGFNTLIVPGMDHAGIATQNVVEKKLAQEGTSRHEIGRERFLERVWQWKEQYADNIRRQFRAMGAGFDWTRERFTMDEGYVDAVLEFFVRLYNEGQIYRGWRVINWCVRCHSAISDIEVDDQEREDTLYYLRYPLKDGSGEIRVATVRPETILGDVAVAVHPHDPRYRDLVGKTAVLPLLNRDLTIVADPMVETEFGTGAVKITPAHDFADFEVAERHHLAMPIVIGTDSRITEVGEQYQGLTVEEARKRVLHDLEAGGYLVSTEPHRHLVPTCDRCGTLLEPLLSEQWFMRMEQLAKPAIDVVKDGTVGFVPERWARVYLDWMENIRPWTLSRQLWWGHRIPVYYCENGHTTVSKTRPVTCSQCGASISHQDPDVLDTWFSSALWPFAVLGWPEQTPDLKRFYPTSFMNTSSQILYLWIARMIMTGLKFEEQVPFPTVLINPTILNQHGQRMSKSLGTGVDPLDLVAQYGADALRFGLMTSGSTHQQDIRFSPDRVEQARNFANKLWNIGRAILGSQTEEGHGTLRLQLEDRWILSRMSAVTQEVTEDLERYEFSGAGQRLFDFVWGELADWYLEMAKLRLRDESNLDAAFTARAVLWSVLDRSLRLLHPYMPFVTEELYQHLRGAGSSAAHHLSGWEIELPESIMSAPWPNAGERDLDADRQVSLLMEAVRSVRATRSEYGLEAGKVVSATVQARDETEWFRSSAPILARLARLQPLEVVAETQPPPNAVAVTAGNISVYLPLDELTDVEAETQRLQKDLAEAERLLGSVIAKLGNESFTARAPAQVVDRERKRRRSFEERVDRLQQQLAALRR